MIYMLPGSTLELGNDTVVGHYANIRPGRLIHLGSNVTIAQFVSIIGDNHRFDDPGLPVPLQGVIAEDVVIDDDAWIGAQVVILPGVRIGRGAVVGAGSIVTKDVAPGALVAGNPARLIRFRQGFEG
jgi:acetyltransferase-like isoleucine patch superfamily enzyme